MCDAHCNETMEEVCVFEESGKPNYCCADCDPNVSEDIIISNSLALCNTEKW